MTQPTFAGSEATAEQRHRTPLEWLGILGPIAGLALVVVFFSNTSWYLVFKSIHVLAAIVWLGGGTIITILGWRALRAKDTAQMLQIGKQAEWAGTRIFMPSSFVVLAMGFVLMHKGGFSYGDFWTIFGLAGWAASFLVGAVFLGPEAGRLAKLIELKGPDDPAVTARLSRILAVARTDAVLVLLVAADMVAKPFLS